MNLKFSRGWAAVLAAAVLGVVAGGVLQAGGWAVVTLQNVPEYLAVGRPATVVFRIRQHGQTLLNGLDGRIEARQGSTLVRATANKLPPDGTYAATLTLPAAGRWTVSVIGGSGLIGDTQSMVLDAVDAGRPAPAIAAEDRGRQIFAGKGCVTCHSHSAFHGTRSVDFVNLSAKRYTPGQVKAFLISVAARPGDISSPQKMPDLGLVAAEIDLLAAFLGE
jgi:hypothetical protein